MTKASEFKSGRDGMMELAKSYSEIRFGTPDPKKAFEWIRKMAAAGGAGAMITLSQAHAVGARVALDIDEQLKHLCLADRPMRAKLDISFRCGLLGAKVEVRVYTDPKGSA